MAGLDANKISPENPFKKSGKTADLLQAAVSEIDPVQSARWRRDSDQGLSVATMAVQAWRHQRFRERDPPRESCRESPQNKQTKARFWSLPSVVNAIRKYN